MVPSEFFRSSVRASTGPGWTVAPDRGRVQVKCRKKGVKPEAITLPYQWEESNFADALLRIRQIFLAYDGDLKRAGEIADVTSSRHETDWEDFVTAFRDHRARVSDRTWKNKYRPVLDAAIEVLKGRNAPTTGPDLCDAALKRWDPGTRQRQIMRQQLHAFLRYCVERKGLKACWLPPPASDAEAVRAKRVGYPLTDAQILRLLDSIPNTEAGQRWRFACQLLAVYGLRPEDLRYLHTREGGAELWSGYEKSQGGRKGARTAPRRLYRLPVGDVDGPVEWNLQGRVHIGELMPSLGQEGKAGEALGTYLRRLPAWASISEEASREGQQLTPYSFRHRFSAEGHRRGLQPKQIADAMGHTLEVHMSSYARFMTRDLANAFEAVNYAATTQTPLRAQGKTGS